MARDEFIGDKLLDMQERLKQNYEQFHRKGNDSAGTEKESVPENSVPQPAAKETTPASLRYMPSLNKGSDDADSKKRRELEGRIIHELAKAECRLELLERKCAELKKYHSVLKEYHEKLLAKAESGDTAALDSLLSGFHLASGRWQAFENDEKTTAPVKSETVSTRGSAFILAGAIIAGCIILSIVLAALFA
ncbi:MAG: hypothetical protein IJC27_10315 [Lentisphaeria bacterium]|nr:hypothetical protein [Lentisphaeria bacterium]